MVWKLIKTIFWLIVALLVFLHGFCTEALQIIGGEFEIYQHGTDYVCVIGFAILSLPAIIEIIKVVKGETKKNSKYYDSRRVKTTVYDKDGDVESVTYEKMTIEKLIANLIPIVAGCALIYIFGPYLAIGFTLYRIGVLIYCIVKLKNEKTNSSSSSSKITADYKVDNKIKPNVNMFKDCKNMGVPVKISAKDLTLFESPYHSDFTYDWTLKLSNAKIKIVQQGLVISVKNETEGYRQIIYVVKVSKDCPSVGKKRGDYAFLLFTNVKTSKKQKANLYFLQGDSEQVANSYFEKEVIKPHNRQIYSEGKYPILLKGTDDKVYTVMPVKTAKYNDEEYLLAIVKEKLPGFKKNQPYIYELNKNCETGEQPIYPVESADLANEIYVACFAGCL